MVDQWPLGSCRDAMGVFARIGARTQKYMLGHTYTHTHTNRHRHTCPYTLHMQYSPLDGWGREPSPKFSSILLF